MKIYTKKKMIKYKKRKSKRKKINKSKWMN